MFDAFLAIIFVGVILWIVSPALLVAYTAIRYYR